MAYSNNKRSAMCNTESNAQSSLTGNKNTSFYDKPTTSKNGPGYCKRKFEGCKILQGRKKQKTDPEASYGTCYINDLPVEVLRLIFSYLFTNDKLACSLVCRNWLNTMNNSSLIDGICVHLPQVESEWCDGGGIYSPSSRQFTTFKFSVVKFSPTKCDFLQKYGNRIKELTLSQCIIEQDLLKFSIGKNLCLNVEALTIDDCLLDIFPMMPYLKKLTVKSHKHVATDLFIVNLNKVIPRLEVLEWNFDHTVHYSDEKIRSVYGDVVSYYDEPSDTDLTLPVLLNFIRSHSKTLVEINIYINEKACRKKLYEEVLQWNDLKLRKMVLHNDILYDTSISSIHNILTNFPTITELVIHFRPLKDEHLNSVCSHLPNLVSLEINDGVNTPSMRNVFRLKRLQSLCLKGEVKNEVFVAALPLYQLNKLMHLELHDVAIEADTLKCLLGKMTGLNTLVLRKVKGLTDENLRFISENLVRLRTLKVSSTHLSDRGVFSECDPRQSLSNIKGLRRLDMYCMHLTGEVLLRAIKFLELHTLILFLRDKIPNFKEQIQKNNPSLRKLYW